MKNKRENPLLKVQLRGGLKSRLRSKTSRRTTPKIIRLYHRFKIRQQITLKLAITRSCFIKFKVIELGI